MIDVLLVLVCALLAASTVAAVEYYRELRKAQKAYEKAKDTVEDIVFSFNRELRREAEAIESVAFKVDGTASKADAGLRKIEGLEKRVAPLESQLSVQQNTFNAVSENNAQTIKKITTVDTKIRAIESSQESIKTKITGLEEQMQKLATPSEVKTELIMPGIPIKRDKAMAALTDTEIAVLEFLSAEGSKTAPEIKERVKLSREHTARLMKKLYEEGYLERETGKLPFKYSVKKEMEKLLRKPENPAT